MNDAFGTDPVDEDIYRLSIREFTEFAVNLKGTPISLDRRPWLHQIYDLPFMEWERMRDDQIERYYRRKMLLIFGRQSEKSTTLGNFLLGCAGLIPYFRMLYVTASNIQMREFSDERLRAVIQDSPMLKRLTGVYGDKLKGETQNVQTKRFVNQSKLLLRSVYKSADRVRGIPADGLAVDEIQDVYADDLPVIEEVLFRSELPGGPISVYSGTPKTFDNSIEIYWGKHSTQQEFMVRCDGCREWHVIDIKHIGPHGLVCDRCSKAMNPVDGTAEWVRHGRENAEWDGFHLCQPIVVHSYANDPDTFGRMWQGILDKKARYSAGKFANEVMGRSYDLGSKPVSYTEVRDCALRDVDLIEAYDSKIIRSQTFAGVDWGTGGESFTVLSIWHYDSAGRFALLFTKRYEGREADPDFAVNDIADWCRKFKVNTVGVDWGFGFHSNKILMGKLGAGRVLPVQYVSNQSSKIVWDQSAYCFKAHRSRVMGDCFELIKRGPRPGRQGCAFVNWDQFETFAQDLLVIYQEYSNTRRQIVYDHPKGRPDDWFHTMVYAFIVSQRVYQRPDINAPGFGEAQKKTASRVRRTGGKPY